MVAPRDPLNLLRLPGPQSNRPGGPGLSQEGAYRTDHSSVPSPLLLLARVMEERRLLYGVSQVPHLDHLFPVVL